MSEAAVAEAPKRVPGRRGRLPHRPGGKDQAAADRRAREQQAIDLRVSGLTFAQIGASLDPPMSESGAYKLLNRALNAAVAESVEELRTQENRRLDLLQRRLMPLVLREEPDLQAVDRVLRVAEARRRLNGLDAPQRHEISGPEGGAVPFEVRVAAVAERVRSLREAGTRVLEVEPVERAG